MKYNFDPKELRIYYKENSCIFKKNNEMYGGLSNMATGFPLCVNGIEIKTTEALYQACRFPHLPDLQMKIIEQKSPMMVKMISNSNKSKSRNDWDSIRIKIMKWCLSVKLAQNFIQFGTTLNETGLNEIVENSAKDNFWGAIPNKDETVFTGINALGRLIMDLRKSFYGSDRYSLLYIEPPQIENFQLYGSSIMFIDERLNFLKSLQKFWNLNNGKELKFQYNLGEITKENGLDIIESEQIQKSKTKISKPKKSKIPITNDQPKLFSDL
jgi:ribA/ribD-fused uncharacterized protein